LRNSAPREIAGWLSVQTKWIKIWCDEKERRRAAILCVGFAFDVEEDLCNAPLFKGNEMLLSNITMGWRS
jgi:hypothetical protein